MIKECEENEFAFGGSLADLLRNLDEMKAVRGERGWRMPSRQIDADADEGE